LINLYYFISHERIQTQTSTEQQQESTHQRQKLNQKRAQTMDCRRLCQSQYHNRWDQINQKSFWHFW